MWLTGFPLGSELTKFLSGLPGFSTRFWAWSLSSSYAPTRVSVRFKPDIPFPPYVRTLVRLKLAVFILVILSPGERQLLSLNYLSFCMYVHRFLLDLGIVFSTLPVTSVPTRVSGRLELLFIPLLLMSPPWFPISYTAIKFPHLVVIPTGFPIFKLASRVSM